MNSLAKLREAAEASPGNAFFATQWSGKGLPLIGMSGKQGYGLELGDLETEDLLYDALREILELYAERTNKPVDCIGQAAWWSSKIFRGEDVRVLMYPDEGWVALDVDNVAAIEHVEAKLGLKPGQLVELFDSAPTLSRLGGKTLHGHHYFKLAPEHIGHVRALMNLATEAGKLGDVINLGSKYQVVHGVHSSGQAYEVFNSKGQLTTLSVIHEAPEFPTWLLAKLEQLDTTANYALVDTVANMVDVDDDTVAKVFDTDDEVQWFYEDVDDSEFFMVLPIG